MTRRHEVRFNGKRVGDAWDHPDTAHAFADGFREGSKGVEPEVVRLRERSWGAPPSEHDIREARSRGYVSGEMMTRRGELGSDAQARVCRK